MRTQGRLTINDPTTGAGLRRAAPSWHRLAMGMIAATTLTFGFADDASAHTYTLHPVADTEVRQAFPNNNYGTGTSLPIRNGGTGQGRYAFQRYEIPPLAGNVVSATWTSRVTGTIQEVGPYAVVMGDPTWAENGLTWNNWSIGSTFTHLGAQFGLAPGTDLNVDVTSWVGGPTATFATASAVDQDGQSFSSREGSVKPKLTIVTDGTLAKCSGPGSLLAELNHRVRTGNLLYACNYEGDLNAGFGPWSGGSENKPVIAAAIALFVGPVVNGTDYRVWWQQFFNQQAATSGSGHINHFKGSELFSTVYDASTVSGIMAAHYWAHLNGHTALRGLAGDYLRRTWYAWSLATSAQPFDAVYRVEGTKRTLVETHTRGCPTVAAASPRSKMLFTQDTKRWLLAKVLGYGQDCYKLPDHKPVIDFISSQYPAVSGLSSAERSALRALIDNTTIPSNLHAVLGAVRMERDYHFLLWNDGRRATYYLGHQLNNNVAFHGAKHTVFSAVFDPSTRDLDLLFIEGKDNTSCIEASTGRVFARVAGVTSCTSTNWIPLPASSPAHHFKLGPSGFSACSSLSC